MEGIQDLFKKIMLNNFEIGSSCWVDITHINNPHSFYVRPRAYNMYLEAVTARGTRLQASEIGIGSTVIFKSYKLNEYVRGKLLSIETVNDKPLYTLFAMDYGFEESSLPLRRIWSPLHDQDLPPLVTHCQLANCGSLGKMWTESATIAMYDYVKDERAKMIVHAKKNDILVVELYNSCPNDIATMLALTDFATLGYVHPSVSLT